VTASGPSVHGVGGRLTQPPAPELVDGGFALECEDGPWLLPDLAFAELCHALHLAELGLGGREVTSLLGVLVDVCESNATSVLMDPNIGDAWGCWEAHLRSLAGPSAGWLTLGRPRREALRVALRLATRREVRRAHAATVRLVGALQRRAAEHAGTPMVDTTYLQPAQPTSLGHVLLAHAYPAGRTELRLRQSSAWLDASPAGAGGTGGASVPVDRSRLAQLLGFSTLATHTRDAMWQTDGFVELLAGLAAGAIGAGQLAADLEVWLAPQFGYARLPDRLSRTSALMPQKRNPYPLAAIRAAGAPIAASLTEMLIALRTGSARTDHFLVAPGALRRALDRYRRAVDLAAVVIEDLVIDEVALGSALAVDFVHASAIADRLVLDHGLGYREAHDAIGRAIRVAELDGRRQLRPDDLLAEGIPAATAEALVSANARPVGGEVVGGAGRAALEQLLAEVAKQSAEAGRWREAEEAREAAVRAAALAEARARSASA
jgi:argininosuccinate lyase